MEISSPTVLKRRVEKFHLVYQLKNRYKDTVNVYNRVFMERNSRFTWLIQVKKPDFNKSPFKGFIVIRNGR